MNAIKNARKLIAADPTSNAAVTLASLVLALESEGDFNIHRIYDLDHEVFELALEILKEWRIDRYYAGKAKLFDMSHQVRQLNTAA
ncbi:hypothetical protein BN948_01472 [Hydrogenophaga intermedia]|uniref:Uncharacterized protein n=1 Tax=Hydrogenophaga intermedia TaxID=65786 RepID=A0A1L1PGD4_HYDIT|nr:hypothetical protein [Hydrogenophaga intermedia]CDN87053.1 hypothetical protein BN948_01472 [Hydrogenophaga intermedia]